METIEEVVNHINIIQEIYKTKEEQAAKYGNYDKAAFYQAQSMVLCDLLIAIKPNRYDTVSHP